VALTLNSICCVCVNYDCSSGLQVLFSRAGAFNSQSSSDGICAQGYQT
jgi:hypothetical protein